MTEIKFEIDDVEYSMPTYINIEDYVKVFKIKDVFSDEYFAAKLINILTGAPTEKILEANYQEVKVLANYAMSLFPIDKQPFIDRFEINGVKYGFIPSWSKLSFAEYVDLDTLITKKPDEVLDYIHIILAIMYRPIISEDKTGYKIETYNQETLEERAQLFKKEVGIKTYTGAQFFFILFAKKYSEIIQESSTTTEMSLWKKMKFIWTNRKLIQKALAKDSDGTLLSTELLPTILQSTMTSSKKPWWKFLTKSRSSSNKTTK
jgi:hypothetical protein